MLLLFFSIVSSNAQDPNQEREPAWKTNLYEAAVAPENFTCKPEDAELVATFFTEHPLSSTLPICHNDCPVVRCRPVVQFPSLARAAKASGTVSVHILVDEQGKTLYARILDGNPLLWAVVRRAACETQFNAHQNHLRQGVMHFVVNDSELIDVPYFANQVR
jgi:hypothetical protein